MARVRMIILRLIPDDNWCMVSERQMYWIHGWRLVLYPDREQSSCADKIGEERGDAAQREEVIVGLGQPQDGLCGLLAYLMRLETLIVYAVAEKGPKGTEEAEVKIDAG